MSENFDPPSPNDSHVRAAPSNELFTAAELDEIRVRRTHKVGPVKSLTFLSSNEFEKDNLPKAHAVRSQYFDEDLAKGLGSKPYAYELPQLSSFAPIYDDLKPAILKNQNDNLPREASYCEVTAVSSDVSTNRLGTMLSLLTYLEKFLGADEYNKFLQFCQDSIGVEDCKTLLCQQMENGAAEKSSN